MQRRRLKNTLTFPDRLAKEASDSERKQRLNLRDPTNF
jgi:hypothetical protein